MKQFLLKDEDFDGKSWILNGDDSHYLRRVRRVKQGDTLMCRTGTGEKFLCTVLLAQESVKLEVFKNQDGSVSRGPDVERGDFAETGLARLHLVQALPKGRKLDDIVRQSVELGVRSIVPVITENTVVDVKDRWEHKEKRLESIIKEAFQQSGGLSLPVLHKPKSLEQFFRELPKKDGNLVLVFHQEKLLAQRTLHEYLDSDPEDLYLLIGPEGGFSPAEIELFEEESQSLVYLGPQVLRTETAALAALAAVKVLLFEKSAWQTKRSYDKE